MPSDPDHVLDAIDGVVDEWLALSEDSMRWAPPEKAPPKRQLTLPAPSLPWVPGDFLHEVGALLGTRAHAVADVVTEVLRPIGEGLSGALTAILDSPPVRQLIDPAGDRPPPGHTERDDLPPEPPPRPHGHP
ncbi:hypothetical protein FHR32_008389 [Streptosporangium album]|uniref:Uncharacterized protein n=1 Tax=Streptosporangium album TaxID=47479 RepID=A0A7W7S667_9ACTN|nr:hypothetical protein [Streptosporangium album]MBB4943988.1 hypothetical protein [Streptosporangium album]